MAEMHDEDRENLLTAIEAVADCVMELIVYARGDNAENVVRASFRNVGEAFIRFAEEEYA